MNIKGIKLRHFKVIYIRIISVSFSLLFYYSNVLYHLYLYLISKLQLTPLLDNGVKMTLKRRSFILLIIISVIYINMKKKVKVKSAYEPGGPSAWTLSRFL